MISILEREDIEPICPHCETGLRTIWLQAVRSTFGKRYVYFCPNCHKVIGISHRKGFWMG